MKWKRTVDFEDQVFQTEKWSNGKKEFDVDVSFTKNIDFFKLKQKTIKDYKNTVDNIKRTSTEIYKNKELLKKLSCCPICNSKYISHQITIYSARYYRCHDCSHVFVIEIPTKEAIEKFYRDENKDRTIYLDKETNRFRLNQVAMPRLMWLIEKYKSIYGREPKSILDVGAGAGHFVKACRDHGLRAKGIELNPEAHKFCKDNFGFELINKDFIESYNLFQDYDIITFWLVLEHIPDPLKMIETAKKVLSKGGLIVADVPRWNSFSTALQSEFKDTITRHLDPAGHIHCFSDSSLATAFVKCGLELKSAWYFGMDMYELLMQFGYNSNLDLSELSSNLNSLQEKVDYSRLCDEIILVGKITEG